MKEFLLVTAALAGILALIYLTYISCKWMSGKVYTKSNKNIKIIEREAVSNDKSLIIVKIGSKNMLLSVTKDNINKLCNLEESDIQINNQTAEVFGFAENLKIAAGKYTKGIFTAKEDKHDKK